MRAAGAAVDHHDWRALRGKIAVDAHIDAAALDRHHQLTGGAWQGARDGGCGEQACASAGKERAAIDQPHVASPPSICSRSKKFGKLVAIGLASSMVIAWRA